MYVGTREAYRRNRLNVTGYERVSHRGVRARDIGANKRRLHCNTTSSVTCLVTREELVISTYKAVTSDSAL